VLTLIEAVTFWFLREVHIPVYMLNNQRFCYVYLELTVAALAYPRHFIFRIGIGWLRK